MNKYILFAIIVLAAGCSTSNSKKSTLSDKELRDSIYNPKPVKERVIWADSWLYAEAPELEVETWLTEKPDTKGKYILIEFWGTYCPPCRKMIPVLNKWHNKYKDDLAIIAISHESVETVQEFKKHKINYYSAVDTQARTKTKLNVTGVPHVIIIEPEYGCIVWEGFPLLDGFELTDKTIKKILSVRKKR